MSDWTWIIIGLLVAAAAAQGFFFWRRQHVRRQAEQEAGLFCMRKGKGYLFFPASLSYCRSLYIDPGGFEIETEGRPVGASWSEVVSVHKVPNPDCKTLRDTYRLLVNTSSGDKPVAIGLGSFREEEVRLILRQIKKYTRVIEVGNS